MRRTTFLAILSLTAAPALSAPAPACLDDANGPSNAEPGPFPRVMLTETQSLRADPEVFSKYGLIGAKPRAARRVAAIQGIAPTIRYHLAFSPRAYQGYTLRDPCDPGMGIPFAETASVSKGCAMFAGHWLYLAGSTATAAVTAADVLIPVADPSRFAAGRYAVLYDAPAGSFGNAEHVLIEGIQSDGLRVRRAYKSTAKAREAGAILAQHDLGQGGGEPRNWAYNVSLAAPADAAGQTVTDVMTAYLVEQVSALPKNLRLSGIYFDADVYMLREQRVDADNDLIADNGWVDGVNVWGLGMDRFGASVRARFPDLVLISGSRRGRGFASLNGTQMEGWPVSGRFDAVNPRYDGADGFESLLQRYSIHLRFHKATPAYVENLSKTASAAHPRGRRVPKTGNAPFRFAFASTLLDDGYFGQQNQKDGIDPWYDEYAVDVVPGSPTFGAAIPSNPSDESRIRAHRSWLGLPLGQRRRLHDVNAFESSKTLLRNGGFEADASGWSAAQATLSRRSGAALEGSGSLAVVPAKGGSARIDGPAVQLKAGRHYTLAVSARAAAIRNLTVRLGKGSLNALIPDQWVRIVLPVEVDTDGAYTPSLLGGRESTPFDVDAVSLFEGRADLHWREFAHGAVLVNASADERQVDLDGRWQRIKGTGQDPVNDGRIISSLTLPPWDAAILVRLERPGLPRERR